MDKEGADNRNFLFFHFKIYWKSTEESAIINPETRNKRLSIKGEPI